MNIQKLTESSNRVFVDFELPKVPEEIKTLASDEEYSFYAFGPTSDNLFLEFSNSQLYIKSDSKIERMDYTGEFYFGDVFFLLGDFDLNIIYKAVFVGGLLKELDVFSEERFDNSERKKAFKKIISQIEKSERLSKNNLYKFIYCPYSVAVNGLFSFVEKFLRVTFSFIVHLIVFIKKIILPL